MLRIFNSLSKTVEDFKPLHDKRVGMYTCGPTVYNFAHIGNFRTYTVSDVLVRTLKANAYDVEYVMNLTDVGHLTGDNAGDADTGEDRMEKAAQKEGRTAWEVAQFYTDAFLEDFEALNLSMPQHLVRATDHIKEQIDLVKTLEEKGYTYETSDGIYFDTSRDKDYGKLSDLDQIREGARVEVNPEKKNQRDFALWKFSYPGGRSFDSAQDDVSTKRQMEWQSPWGIGFPGWHIECSAMSMKYLGDTLDIHAGGIDLKQTHHPNEIAQSESATGKKFARYWMHVAFVLVQGERMSKSVGNTYRVYDLTKMGYHPMSLRYLYLQTHYRQEMNFTFPALDGAENALKKLYTEAATWGELDARLSAPAVADNGGQARLLTPEHPPATYSQALRAGSDGGRGNVPTYEEKFLDALNNDLNTSEALAVMWELVKSDYPSGAKLASLFKMDEVLGLKIKEAIQTIRENEGIVPDHIKALVAEREHHRKNRRFSMADKVRAELKKLGYEVEDSKKGPKIKRIT